MATPRRFRLRTYRRVPIHGTMFFLSEQIHGRGFVWNHSPNGCRIDAKKKVPAGTELTLPLHLDRPDERIYVDRAVVARSRGHELGLTIHTIENPR